MHPQSSSQASSSSSILTRVVQPLTESGHLEPAHKPKPPVLNYLASTVSSRLKTVRVSNIDVRPSINTRALASSMEAPITFALLPQGACRRGATVTVDGSHFFLQSVDSRKVCALSEIKVWEAKIAMIIQLLEGKMSSNTVQRLASEFFKQKDYQIDKLQTEFKRAIELKAFNEIFDLAQYTGLDSGSSVNFANAQSQHSEAYPIVSKQTLEYALVQNTKKAQKIALHSVMTKAILGRRELPSLWADNRLQTNSLETLGVQKEKVVVSFENLVDAACNYLELAKA